MNKKNKKNNYIQNNKNININNTQTLSSIDNNQDNKLNKTTFSLSKKILRKME